MVDGLVHTAVGCGVCWGSRTVQQEAEAAARAASPQPSARCQQPPVQHCQLSSTASSAPTRVLHQVVARDVGRAWLCALEQIPVVLEWQARRAAAWRFEDRQVGRRAEQAGSAGSNSSGTHAHRPPPPPPPNLPITPTPTNSRGSASGRRINPYRQTHGWLQHLRSCITMLSRRERSAPPVTASMSFCSSAA